MGAIQEGKVKGFLHWPEAQNGNGLVLTHGAGANANAALLVAVAEAFCRAGFLVLRCDLPFRQRRPFGPPSPATGAEDRAGLREAVGLLRTMAPRGCLLGGHSYGGRMATMLAADEPELAEGLLLLSYPLHPPEKPEKARTEHLPRLSTPALFVHGTKDPFGSIAEMEEALRLIPTQTRLMPVDRAGHDLARGKFDLAAVVNYFAAASGSASVI